MIVGEAQVLVTPITRGFAGAVHSQTAPALGQFSHDAEKAGAEAGAGLHKGFGRGVGGIASTITGLGVPFNTLDGRITKTVDQLAKVEAGTSKLGRTMASVGGTALAGTALALGGVAAAGVDLALKQEKVTVSISNSARISEQAAHQISDAFLGTAGSAIYSGRQIGAAYQPVAGMLGAVAGHALSSGEAMKFMKASIDLAEASGNELGVSTQTLAKVMQAYKVGVDGAAGASDVLWNTSRQTGLGIDQLATVLGRVKGKLGELAPSLGESAGLLNTLAKAGVTGRIAVSALSTGYTTLLGHGKATDQMAKDLNLRIFDQHGKFVGLRSVIEQLNPRISHLSQEQQLMATKALFGAGASRQMLEVILKGPAAFDRATAAVQHHGSAQQAAERQAHTLSGQMKVLRATAEDLATKIGEKLIPILTKLAGGLSDGIKWLEKHSAVAKALAVVIATVLGAAIGSFVAVRVAGFVGGVKQMISMLGALGARFIGTAAVVEGADAAIATSAEETAVAVDAALIGTGIGVAVVALGIAAFELKEHWSEVMRGIEEATAAAANFVIGMLNQIIEAFNETVGVITGDVGKIGEVVANAAEEGTGRWAGEKRTGGGSAAEAEAEGTPREAGRSKAHFGKGAESSVTQWAAIAERAAAKYGIPASLLLADISQESGGTEQTSSAGAKGITQFIPETAAKYGVKYGTSLADIESQIMGQAHYLRDLGAAHNPKAALEGYVSGKVGSSIGATYAESVLHKQSAYRGADHAAAKHAAAVEHNTKAAEKLTGATEKLAEHTKAAHQKAAHHVVQSTKAITSWAEKSVGKFAESSGANRGPELDRLQAEFHTRAAAWCAEFATTAAMMGGANKAVRTASVATIREWAQQGSHGYHKGISHTPAAGEIAMFGNAHAGFVQSVDRAHGTYVDIEGNTSAGRVARVTRKIGEGDFARPAYKKIETGGVELQRASKAFETAGKEWVHHVTAETKLGQTQLSKIVGAIHSGGVKELSGVVGGKHDKWLQTMIDKLHRDHVGSLDKLAAKLVDAHKKALVALQAALVKVAEEAEIKRLGQEDTLHKDQAEYEATRIGNETKVALDKMAEIGKTGADLQAAQAQTQLDSIKAADDLAITQAKQAYDQSIGHGELAEARAKSGLEAAENAAKVHQAEAQRAVDLANADATQAKALEEQQRTEDEKLRVEKERLEQEKQANAGEATPGPPASVNFTIYGGHGMSVAELMGEISWSLKTGALPVAAPVVASTVGLPA